jgi:hypothetical protein
MKFFHNRLSIGIEGLLSRTRWSMFGLSKMAPFQYASLFYVYYCFWLKMPTTSSWWKDHNLNIWSYNLQLLQYFLVKLDNFKWKVSFDFQTKLMVLLSFSLHWLWVAVKSWTPQHFMTQDIHWSNLIHLRRQVKGVLKKVTQVGTYLYGMHFWSDIAIGQ